ncbi:MAG TPA: SDR family NAD(P)-dependent oxidoreductase [Solirubrobacterales bacterium]
MSANFEDRVALITGAGRGLGRAHALLLASRGAAVVVADLGVGVGGDGDSAGPAQEVVEEIRAAGGEAVAATESVAEPSGGEALVAGAIETYGRLDIVINNAGILRDRSFAKLTDEDIDAVLAVHLKGAFNVTRPAWLQMRERGYGRILNTASSSGILGNFGQANYGAAKMGLVGLTRVLAIEGFKHGIQVNALAPMARTRMTENLLGDLVEALDPELVAPVAAWLVHEDCEATGEIYTAAAGRVARFFVGMTRGHFDPDLTIESVRDNFDRVREPEGYLEPRSAADEIAFLSELLAEQS